MILQKDVNLAMWAFQYKINAWYPIHLFPFRMIYTTARPSGHRLFSKKKKSRSTILNGNFW